MVGSYGVAVSYKRGTPVDSNRCVLIRFSNTREIAKSFREIGMLLPNNQRQHRTSHAPKDVLPLRVVLLRSKPVSQLALGTHQESPAGRAYPMQ